MVKNKINMCEGPILGPMIAFIIPILLTGSVQQLFNAADVVLAGRLGTSGSDAVAAVGSTTAITALLINFFFGCSTGSAVTLSHALGSKNEKQIKETVHTAMLLSVTIGLLLSVVGISLSETILSAISTPKNIIKSATLYLQTYFTGMVPYMVYYFGTAILRTGGETQKPLYYLLISGPVKLVLTVVFVSGFKMDVVGLALANTCSQTVAATLIVINLLRRNDSFKIRIKELRFSPGVLGRILRFGIPSGVQSATFSLSTVFIQSSVNSLSYLKGFITGNAAASSIIAFADVISGSFYQASLSFSGQNVGANKYDRLKQAFLINIVISSLFTAVISALICLFAKPLLGIYIADSKEAVEWGAVRILFIFAPLVFQSLMDVTTGGLRGMGVSFSNAVISLIGICGLRILWCFTVFNLEGLHTPQILYLCYPVSWVITFLLQLIIFMIVFKKRKKKFSKQ